jgi:periplasmic protein TonB
MLRLRTTVGLSLLALAVGVAGTAWLSTLTDHWAGPPARAVAHADKVRAILRRHTHSARAISVGDHAAKATTRTAEPVAVLPTLTPIDMPPPAASFFRRGVPLNGRVVLHLSVDGDGRVMEAAVAQTSGNVDLDDRAMHTVLGWRFVVPADHPDGLKGALVMRFDEGGDRALSAP